MSFKNLEYVLNELEHFYNYCSKEQNLNVIGLMAIPPNDDKTKKYFEIMQEFK